MRRLLQNPATMLGHLAQRVDDLSGRLDLSLENTIRHRRENFTRLESSLLHHSPSRQTDQLRQKISFLSSHAERQVLLQLESVRKAFVSNTARLDVLSPLSTLSRGYSIVIKKTDGKVLNDASDLVKGDRLDLRFNKGRAVCAVEEVEQA